MTGPVRLFPLLVFAGVCLLVLKAMGLLLSGGYVLSGVAPAVAQNPQAGAGPAGESDAIPAEDAAQAPGPADNPKPAATAEAPAPRGDAEKPERDGKAAGQEKLAETKAPEQDDPAGVRPLAVTTRSELAVIEGLSNRRKALDQREREIDLRENLLKAAEKRVEARIEELKAIEARIESELMKRDGHRQAQYESLVKMYSGMRPKDAARIFNRLELDVLAGLVTKMKPRVMSAIMAEMAPAAAERLTLEFASMGRPEEKASAAATLPKIESRKAN